MSEGPPTVVVVDDAAEVRSLVKTRLRLSRRFDVVGEGATGVEAVELAARHRPALLLLDVSMPRMDGLEALPRIRQVSPGTRVVMYTGFDERGLADRARELGAAGLIEKSASIDCLVDDLAAALGAHRGAEADPGAGGAESAGDAPGDGAGDRQVLDEHLERFREVFEEAAIGMATMTLTGRIVRTNKAFAGLVGRPADELVGLPFATLTSGAGAAKVATALDDIRAGITEVAPVELEVPVRGGSQRISATIGPVRDARWQPLYLFLQVQDVTARHAAEEALGLSEERFRLLVQAVEDYAIFMLDPQGRIVSWNAGAQRIKGYRAEEIIGQHLRVFYPVEVQAARHPEHELQLAARDGQYEEEGWRVRKDGSRFWANVLITAVRNPAGELIGFAKVTRDITERRQAEEALRQSEERFRLLVQAVEDYAIFMLDPQGRIVSWNAGAQRIKGYRAEEIIGQHLRVFYPVEVQAARHPEHELQLAARDGQYEEEGWRVRKDGSRFWANVLITAVRNPAGELIGFAKVTRDITDRRRILEEREEAATALAAANRELETANERLVQAAADQSQFLAMTAHELRTPIGVLGGFADTLAEHWRDLGDEERTEMLASMASSASRLRRLVADLLTASRLDAGAVDLRPQSVDVAAVLTRTAAAARGTSPGAQVTVDCPPGVMVLADPDRLAQALDNLAGNAVRHGSSPVALTAVPRGRMVEIRVSDAGPGVPVDLRSRLFQRFATGEGTSGTGLGLFIVRELARAHGGDAWYEPGEPPSARPCFVLSLPAVA